MTTKHEMSHLLSGRSQNSHREGEKVPCRRTRSGGCPQCSLRPAAGQLWPAPSYSPGVLTPGALDEEPVCLLALAQRPWHPHPAGNWGEAPAALRRGRSDAHRGFRPPQGAAPAPANVEARTLLGTEAGAEMPRQLGTLPATAAPPGPCEPLGPGAAGVTQRRRQAALSPERTWGPRSAPGDLVRPRGLGTFP